MNHLTIQRLNNASKASYKPIEEGDLRKIKTILFVPAPQFHSILDHGPLGSRPPLMYRRHCGMHGTGKWHISRAACPGCVQSLSDLETMHIGDFQKWDEIGVVLAYDGRSIWQGCEVVKRMLDNAREWKGSNNEPERFVKLLFKEIEDQFNDSDDKLVKRVKNALQGRALGGKFIFLDENQKRL